MGQMYEVQFFHKHQPVIENNLSSLTAEKRSSKDSKVAVSKCSQSGRFKVLLKWPFHSALKAAV